MSNRDQVEFLVNHGLESQSKTARRSSLITSSQYLKDLIRNSKTEPIVVDNVEPKIFNAVVDFAQFLGNFKDDDEWVELADAAQKLTINSLGQLASLILEEKFSKLGNDSIWRALDRSYQTRYAASACEKVLSKETSLKLKSKQFLEIRPEALSRFLAIEKMEIKSEFFLVKECIWFVRHKDCSAKDTRQMFRKYALPHLRLLTLTYEELFKVASFLTREEVLFLYHNLHEKKPLLTVKDVPEMRDSLCLVKTPRYTDKTTCTLTIVPQFEVQSMKDLFLEGMFSVLPWEVNKFVLSFQTKKKIRIKRVDVFCPLYLQENHFFDEQLIMNLNKMDANYTFKTTNQPMAKIVIKSKNGDKIDLKLRKVNEAYMNRWVSFPVDVVVPQHSLVKLQVVYNGNVVLRHLERSVKSILKESPECVSNTVHELTLEQIYKDKHQTFRCVKKAPITVFKDLQLSVKLD